MLDFQLKDKKAFICGVSDDKGFGFAIAKALYKAGCKIYLGTWVPTYNLLQKSIEMGKLDESLHIEGHGPMQIEEIFPIDAAFDTYESIPQDIRESKRYQSFSHYSIQECVEAFHKKHGKLDILVHSLANAPEVKSPLSETSREGYLAALSASSYSLVSLATRFAPYMNPDGACLALSYLAAEKTIPGYGGGMSSAKAALESDVKTLAWELGRKWGLRLNAISAGAMASRAAKAIGFIEKMIHYSQKNAPLTSPLTAEQIANSACFLLSPLASAITGENLHVDNGLHTMGVGISAPELIDL